MNTITLLGRLGKDVDLKTSKNEKHFATFSVATNDGFGENKKTNWHNCIAFGKTAEIIAKYVKKGDELCIRGSVEYALSKDKIYTNIIVNEFTFVSGGKKTEQKKVEPQQSEDDDDLPF